ncbi:hypothetical protein GSI_09708 [Ganoderma sinense ZZ0214-1]|uniref:HAT C-terminal dimerisation domain-containing protein n=1 Tax=Ganoderma sinense ZZ0214-1 TaxID=1077348 RepID=A0A2G8S341_9APHY|nr:hypothetical protein GSI_09708 [Ganoderma sinense ZZ0214-1]
MIGSTQGTRTVTLLGNHPTTLSPFQWATTLRRPLTPYLHLRNGIPPSRSDAALQDATGHVLNNNGKRTSTSNPSGEKPRKKRKTRAPPPPLTEADLPLTGPTAPRATVANPVPITATLPSCTTPAPLHHFGSVLRTRLKTSDSTGATDVWANVHPSKDGKQPDVLPVNEPRSRSRPDKEYRLKGIWKSYNISNGQTETFRDHFKAAHFEEWNNDVINNQLKGWEKLGFKNGVLPAPESSSPGTAQPPPEPFIQKGLSRRIVQWIAHSDQAINVVEDPLFRELLIYASTSPRRLEDKNILHRTLAHKLLVQEYEREMDELRTELKGALGRISFTCDLWSSVVLRSFFAITLHYVAEDGDHNIVLRSRLGAFRHILERHTGENLAEQFIAIVEELGILDKIGCITVDNAGNNNTMMAELEKLLKERNPHLQFSAEGNHIRCFPHVVNISVKHGLKALTEIPETSATVSDSASTNPVPSEDPDDYDFLESVDPDTALSGNPELLQVPKEYLEALASDPIKRARNLVTVCRASGQRRADLMRVIKEGNCESKWPNGEKIPEVQLLRDVDTRWSSILLMIDRLLTVYLGIEEQFKDPKYEDLRHHLLNSHQLQVLQDIREFLLIPHNIQELVSGDQTPTAPVVLPLYERFYQSLKKAVGAYPFIAHGIQASMTALHKYMVLTRKTRAYALAMVINPAVKLDWLEKHWAHDEAEAARAWVIEAMLEFRVAGKEQGAAKASDMNLPRPGSSGSESTPIRSSTTSTTNLSRTTGSGSMTSLGYTTIPASNSRSARSLQHGLDMFAELERRLEEKAAQISGTSNRATPVMPAPPSPASQETDEERLERLHAEDQAAVQQELQKYVSDGLDTRDPSPFGMIV